MRCTWLQRPLLLPSKRHKIGVPGAKKPNVMFGHMYLSPHSFSFTRYLVCSHCYMVCGCRYINGMAFQRWSGSGYWTTSNYLPLTKYGGKQFTIPYGCLQGRRYHNCCWPWFWHSSSIVAIFASKTSSEQPISCRLWHRQLPSVFCFHRCLACNTACSITSCRFWESKKSTGLVQRYGLNLRL